MNVLALLSGEFVGLNFLFTFKFMIVERGVQNGHFSHFFNDTSGQFFNANNFLSNIFKKKIYRLIRPISERLIVDHLTLNFLELLLLSNP